MDDSVSLKAYNNALLITRSKYDIAREFFSNITRYYKFAIIFTVITSIIMTIAYSFKICNFNAYISSVIVIVIAFVFEFGVSLKEELNRRQIEELD